MKENCFVWGVIVFLCFVIVSCSAVPGGGNSGGSNNSSSGPVTLPTGAGVYVATNGSDANTGLTISTPVKSIQYAVSQALSNNLSYVFIQEGYYTTNAGLSNANTSVLIQSNGLTVYGGCDSSFSPKSGHFSILDGQSATKNILLLWSATNVTLYGLVLMRGSAVNGGGCLITNSSGCVITNCSFVSNTAAQYGGGLELIYSTSNIISSIFISNNAAGWGGGLSLRYSSYNRVNSSFYSNASASGGGVYIRDNSVNNTFSGNFVNNVSLSAGAGKGGGIDIESTCNGNTIDNCYFNNNYTKGDSGGGIFVNMSVVGTKIINSSIIGNYAGTFGGGCYVFGDDSIISNCVISGNSTTNNGMINYGGGIYLMGSNSVVVSCSISSNSTALYVNNQGGGMFSGGKDTTIRDTQIFSNTAGMKGGGFMITGSNTMVSNCSIYNNRVTNSTDAASGGGAHIAGIDSKVIECRIYNNATSRFNDSGGGLYVSGKNVLVKWCDIYGNSSDIGGGAAFAVTGAGNSATMYVNVISNNSASTYGAGVSVINGIIMSNNGIYDNGTPGNPSGGGGIYAINSWGTIYANTVTNNNAVLGRGMWIENSALTNEQNQFINYGINILLKGNTIDGGLRFYQNTFAGPGYGSIDDCWALSELSPDTVNHILDNNYFYTNTMRYLYYEQPSVGVTNIITNNAGWTNINNINFTGAKIATGNSAN